MKINKNRIYFAKLFLCSFLLAIFAKRIRQIETDLDYLDIILGVAPSFFYAVGMLSLASITLVSRPYQDYFKIASFIILGACIYEFEQMWTAMYFDVLDICFTVLAYIIMNRINILIRKPAITT